MPPPPPAAPQPPAVISCLYVVREDWPIYEIDLSGAGRRDDSPHLDQFIVYAALDAVDVRLANAAHS